MRWSEYFLPTLKEDPQDAEAASHKLMVRSGMIRRLTAGSYTYLPLGFKVLKKVERILREEMDSEGAQELLMPALQPAGVWKRTNRYEEMGQVMISFSNRHGREMVLGPTHEEIITGIVASELRSYKELPYILYQIQHKFRDEVRARFGVVRSCEFLMKDAYSFDVDASGLEVSYEKMYEAYCRIFSRCGLRYVPVKADPGLMGGEVSHEFMVPSPIGEDKIAKCTVCSWAASSEVAECASTYKSVEEKQKELVEEETPGKKSVHEVAEFLSTSEEKIIKTLFYDIDGEKAAILLRGDHEANEVKIKRRLQADKLRLAKEDEILRIGGGDVGFSGPVGLDGIRIYADFSVRKLKNAVTGANKKDRHLKNVNFPRDFKVDKWLDLRNITVGDVCPDCSSEISLTDCIEIGHTFKLGTKYSKALEAKFLSEDGKEKTAIMGCYGIGVNRIIAALIENSHDADGIIWPLSVAPFEVVVMPLKTDDEDIVSSAEDLYEKLSEDSVDVLIDDRSVSAGIKFKDADLVGFPVQVVIGRRALSQGNVEIKVRKSGEKKLVKKDKAIDEIGKILNELKK